MTVEWFDREGKPITTAEFERLVTDKTRDYRRVALNRVGRYEVSTVWLGLSHNWRPSGPPLIFETMVFGDGPLCGDLERYATEAAALAGHDRWVMTCRDEGTPPPMLGMDPSHREDEL